MVTPATAGQVAVNPLVVSPLIVGAPGAAGRGGMLKVGDQSLLPRAFTALARA
jgi:hypothetical protein